MTMALPLLLPILESYSRTLPGNSWISIPVAGALAIGYAALSVWRSNNARDNQAKVEVASVQAASTPAAPEPPTRPDFFPIESDSGVERIAGNAALRALDGVDKNDLKALVRDVLNEVLEEKR